MTVVFTVLVFNIIVSMVICLRRRFSNYFIQALRAFSQALGKGRGGIRGGGEAGSRGPISTTEGHMGVEAKSGRGAMGHIQQQGVGGAGGESYGDN